MLISTDGGAQQHRIVGGSQQIAISAAERLGDRILFSSPVRRIIDDGESVAIQADERRGPGRARDRRDPADPDRPDRLPARAARLARPAHPAHPAGLGDQVHGRLRRAVLARRGVLRPGHQHRRTGQGRVRQHPPGLEHRRAARLPRRRTGPHPRAAAARRAPRRRDRVLRPLLRAPRRQPDRLHREVLGRRAVHPRLLRRLLPARRLDHPRAPACAPPADGSTGPAPRPPRSGTATWTARSAPANAQPQEVIAAGVEVLQHTQPQTPDTATPPESAGDHRRLPVVPTIPPATTHATAPVLDCRSPRSREEVRGVFSFNRSIVDRSARPKPDRHEPTTGGGGPGR